MNIGMVFGFIFAIIVIGFLLASGGNLINKIFGLQGDVQIAKQMADIQSAVYTDSGSGIFWSLKGSVDTINVKVGGGAEKICFFNPAKPSKNPSGNWLPEKSLEGQIQSKNYTAGIFEAGGNFNGYKIDKLLPSSNFCIDSASRLTITNTGKNVDIKLEG